MKAEILVFCWSQSPARAQEGRQQAMVRLLGSLPPKHRTQAGSWLLLLALAAFGEQTSRHECSVSNIKTIKSKWGRKDTYSNGFIIRNHRFYRREFKIKY